MNDRELLERAAKAAGYVAVPNQIGDKYWGDWSPLTDDSDALRLAVKCNLLQSALLSSCLSSEPDGDPYAATRRAIVRAAAALGDKL